MAENGTRVFSNADGYAAGFGEARIDITIAGAGDFEARLTRLKLNHLGVWRCCESLPRIAFISLPSQQTFLSFPVGRTSLVYNGFALRHGDMVLHGRGERAYQRSKGACQWGLISLSCGQFARCAKALTGRPITSSQVSQIFRPGRAEMLRFQLLFREACRLAESKRQLIKRPEVARALEQEILHAIINCLITNATEDNQTRHRHAAIMVRFEQMLSQHAGQKLNIPALCAEIGVPERSLRLCCSEFLGVSPREYFFLRQLNKVRSALQRADRSIATVAEIARNHHFHEPGRFAVMYRAAFGESPSVTLQRGDPSSQPAGIA